MNKDQSELREGLICVGPEYFVFHLLSKSIKTKIYRTISLNIVLYGLSNHNAQLLKLHNYFAPVPEFTSRYVRNINSFTVNEFQSKLSTGSWEDIFEGFDTNVKFNNFLNIHLIIFYACFTKSELNSTHRYNLWITGPNNLGPVNNKRTKVRTRGVPGKRKQKIIIIVDSHAKRCAAEITHNLGRTFEVTGYAKPGTKLGEITNIARKETEKLTKTDMIVVSGGANNIVKNESGKGLVHISNFVKQRKHTNIIIVSAPKRHDLSTTLCVNSGVTTYNTKLHKRMKMFEYVKFLHSEVQREHFTRHEYSGKRTNGPENNGPYQKNLVSKEDTSHNFEMEARPHRQRSGRS